MRRMPLTSTKTSAFCVASTRFSARASPRPVIWRSCSTTRKIYCRGRAQARADGRAAQVHHAQAFFALVDAPAVAGNGLGIGATFRAQRHEHRILKLGAADLDHVGKRLFLLLERLQQHDDFPLQLAQAADGGHAERRREGVVGRLVQVEVIVRVDASLVAQRPAEQSAGRDWPTLR